MPTGNIDEMIAAFQNRIDELSSGLIESAEDIMSACKDDICEDKDSENEPIYGMDNDLVEPVVAQNEFIDKFCWEIQDAVMGCDIDCDSVECTFSGENFTITVELPDGSEEDFIVPLTDLTGDVETLEDDLDYVVGTIEAELG